MDKGGLCLFGEEMETHPFKYNPGLLIELCPLHEAPVLLCSWKLLHPLLQRRKMKALRNKGLSDSMKGQGHHPSLSESKT